MSKSEDYLDDLLNSVSDINKRNNKKDIESLLKSMEEPQEPPKEREKKRTPRRRDYGEKFVREFEQEIVNGATDDFLRDFELELDAEAADIEESMGDEPEEKPVEFGAEKTASSSNEAISPEPDVNDMMGELLRKVGGGEPVHPEETVSADDLMVNTMEMPETSAVSEEESFMLDEENAPQDLMDILSLSEDGDLADIGSMLQADESGEMNLADFLGEQASESEEENPEDTRDEFERLGSIEELKDLKEAKKKKAKKGFFARLSTFFFGDEEAESVKVPEEDALGSLSDENADILKELDESEKGTKGKKAKKEKKEKKKKEPKSPKAPKAKKEKKPKEKDTTPPLPKKPVILISVMAASIFLLIMLGSSNLQYSADIQTAKESLQRKDYVEAYTLLAGSKIRAKDEKLYQKVLILSSVQAEYQSYYNLSNMGQYDMALDALIRGYGRCLAQEDEAADYDVVDELAELQQQITTTLQDEMGVSSQEAAALYEMTDRQEYTRGIHQILQNTGLE